MPNASAAEVSEQTLSSMPSNRNQGAHEKPPPSPGSTTGSSFDASQNSSVEKAVAAAAAAAAPLKEGAEGQPETKGWLYKWTNYIKGYQKRWFVLANGLLHYYRNQAEMARTCRGSISLHNGHIYTEDSCNFVVSNAGGTQTYHLRAASEVERQHWVTVLELAKTKALQRMVSENGEIDTEESDGVSGGDIDKQELTNVVKFLSSKLEDLRMCHQLVDKHRHALQHSLSELEISGNASASNTINKDSTVKDLGIKIKTVNERATLLNITCNAMINASSEFLEHCQNNGKRWHRILENEREIRQNLEDMVQQLAKQHSHLESMVKKEHEDQQHTSMINSNSVPVSNEENKDDKKDTLDRSGSALGSTKSSNPNPVGRSMSSNYSGTDSGDDEFEDALDDQEICFNVPVPPSRIRKTSSEESIDSSGDEPPQDPINEATFNVVQRKSEINIEATDGTLENMYPSDDMSKSKNESNNGKSVISNEKTNKLKSKEIKQRRSTVPEKPNISFSLWSIMKNCIGKDLSKIPVPVNFSEPTSMLQRLMEDFEYSEVLHKASQCKEDCEQLAYVAAFTVSAYSTTAIRTGKPFNPLLGETYECDRTDDKHFRCFSEQVTHHPPMVAQYCESSRPGSKPGEDWKCWQEFTMRSRFRGKYLEVEPLGIAHLVFPKTGNHYTWRKVKTVVHNIVVGKLWIDQHGEMEVINHFTGDKCHMKFEPYSYFAGIAKKVIGTITNKNGKVEWVLNGTWDSKLEGSRVIGESKSKGKANLEIENSKILWKANPPYPGSEKFYNFSKFTCELNEEEEGVAPTDSRLRPDQRLMENGEWDEANTEKVRLEDKQRAVRRKREAEEEMAAQEGRPYEGYQPLWFNKVKDEQNGEKLIHIYKGGYWEAKETQNWEMCPDIF